MDDDFYSNSGCHCGMYTQCEHKNWVVDEETMVRKVVSKWVEDGSNLLPHGSHGNWVVGVKDDECHWFNLGEASENDDSCYNQEFDRTDAAGHQFDSRGFFIDLQPLPKPQLIPTTGPPQAQAVILSDLMSNGLISQPEYDTMMAQLQRDYERMRERAANDRRTAGPRYRTYPVHTSRPQGLMQRVELPPPEGGVPYVPDFRLNPQSLASTMSTGDWTPDPVFQFDDEEDEVGP